MWICLIIGVIASFLGFLLMDDTNGPENLPGYLLIVVGMLCLFNTGRIAIFDQISVVKILILIALITLWLFSMYIASKLKKKE